MLCLAQDGPSLEGYFRAITEATSTLREGGSLVSFFWGFACFCVFCWFGSNSLEREAPWKANSPATRSLGTNLRKRSLDAVYTHTCNSIHIKYT